MSEPNDSLLAPSVRLHRHEDGQIDLSKELATLLVEYRRDYEWPTGAGIAKSQKAILDLEQHVWALMREPTTENAHAIFERVSEWGGNNRKSHLEIKQANSKTKTEMLSCLKRLGSATPDEMKLYSLSAIPGVRLVIASKIFRFCCPDFAAAVDRHASYFFNSLDVYSRGIRASKATHFKREWANGRRSASRLAAYTPGSFKANVSQYCGVYLPLLRDVAERLNSTKRLYTCAATGHSRRWRPTDVEMAAYYWWARNGAR